MRSPAAALAWEFRQRHRFAVALIAGYAVAMTIAWMFLFGPGRPLQLDREAGLAATVTVPAAVAYMYLVAVFSFGLEGDLAAMPSIFPRRFFTLPVTTASLAAWPMLMGGIVSASLCFVVALAAREVWGFDLSVVWPPVLGMVFLAWTQVLTWTAYPLPGLRIAAAALCLAAFDAVVLLALQFKMSEPRLVTILAVQLPLAYLAARRALIRARQGDGPDWRGAFAAARARRFGRPGHRPFRSAANAQLWFEWRQEGWVLPTAVGLVTPFALALLYLCRAEPKVMTLEVLAFTLLTPPFLAGMAGAVGGQGRAEAPFSMTRPVSTRALIGAKFKMAALSTIVAWLPLWLGIPAVLRLSGTTVVTDWIRDTIDVFGVSRAAVLLALLVAGLPVWTWRQVVQGFYIRLAGGDRLVKASIVLRLLSLVIIIPLAHWLLKLDGGFWVLWDYAFWALAMAVVLKTAAAGLVVPRLHSGGLVPGRTLVGAVAAWLVSVLALYGVLVWLFCTPALVPRYPALLIAILCVPLVRISAALLALGHSRHRGKWSAAVEAARETPRTSGLIRALIALPVLLVMFEALAFEIAARNNGTILSSGVWREYLLHVPPIYDGSKPVPLVISLHGAALWPAGEMAISGWNDLADREGFIVVYPSAISKGPRAWHMNGSSLDRNVRFISDLLDKLKGAYRIDSTRIYADGLSNGGGMAFVLSCRLSDRIAAVGLVASAQLLPFSWCGSERAVPVIAFHGTADRSAPYWGGNSWAALDRFENIPGFVGQWAARNHCQSDPVDSPAASEVTRREYRGCKDDASVVLYAVNDGGHSWPGGGATPEWVTGFMTRSIDASRLMWEFYRAHPLRDNDGRGQP